MFILLSLFNVEGQSLASDFMSIAHHIYFTKTVMFSFLLSYMYLHDCEVSSTSSTSSNTANTAGSTSSITGTASSINNLFPPATGRKFILTTTTATTTTVRISTSVIVKERERGRSTL